jgi:hypothetical protein
MIKYFKWQSLVLVGLLAISCAKDKLAEGSRSISFTKKITSYVAFDVPESELSLGEKLLRMPKSDVRKYTFSETQEGLVNISIVQNPNLEGNSDYQANTLGAPRKISWQSGRAVSYSDETAFSNSAVDGSPANFDDVVKTYRSKLVSEAAYDYFIEALRQNMTVEDLDENMVVITANIPDGASKSYFDKRCQKEVAMELYDSGNNLISRNSSLYTVDGDMVYLAATITTTFKKSPDSDHIMSLITVSNYQMH